MGKHKVQSYPLRMNPDTREKLERIAKKTDTTIKSIINDALEEYLTKKS